MKVANLTAREYNLLIPMLIIAILIKLDSAGSVFYRQERVTIYGKHFRIHKFRTMAVDSDKIGTSITVSHDSRITRVEQKLRRLRLDERVIIGQTTESLENKGVRKVSPIHFHRGHDLFFYNAGYANIKGKLCQSA